MAAEKKRIIPCLDVKDGRVVKGVNFVNIRDAGDPVELAALYEQEGADELFLLDISATEEGRTAMLDVVKRIAEAIAIPFSVGGGISQVAHMERLLHAGVSKVSISSAAVARPELIREGAEAFGSERIVAAIDASYNEAWNDWEVYVQGGKKATGLRAIEWVKRVEQLGAGEILLTSMSADGTKEGFDVRLTRAAADAVSIPIIASGGAGTSHHFYDVLTEGKAAAGLAASIFHFKQLSIGEVKADLKRKGVDIY